MIHKIVHLVSFFRLVDMGGGGEIVLDLIDILEESYQSEISVIVSIIIVL